ncbi:MAG: glutathione S-transferase family protein [Pontibacterium sp.]
MIKLYGGVFSRGSMVMCALETLGLEYESVPMRARDADTQAAAYLALNPTGKIPTLVDGELVLWETQAILFYLAQKYGEGLLWAETPEAVAEIYRWSLFVSNQMEVPALELLLQMKYSSDGKGDAEKVAAATAELHRFLPVLESRLEGHRFVAADKQTVADIHGAGILAWAKLAGFDYDRYPHVHAWIKRQLSSDAQQRVMAQA